MRELAPKALARGAGLALAWILVEAADRLRVTWETGYRAPGLLIAVSTGVLLAVGLLLGFLWGPLLRLGRGTFWHPLALSASAAALLLGFAAPAGHFLFKYAGVGAATAGLYAAGLVLARRPAMRRAALGAGTVLALALLLAPLAGGAGGEPGPRPAPARAGAPNVLFIVLDTVRADRLDLMGYDRPTFPYLVELGREGAVFERAVAPAPWTLPSHASMFTGLYPSAHGAHHENNRLSEDRVTLAEILRRRGWETVAYSANPWISASTGLTQGFAVQDPVWLAQTAPEVSFAWLAASSLGWIEADNNGRAVTRAWLRWLDGWDGERPFFAFLNYLETHFPYDRLPKEYLASFSPPGTSKDELAEASKAVVEAELHGWRVTPERAARVNDLYDASIRYEGDLIRRAVEAVRARGELDRTVLVLVSDHGDLLGEHGGLFQHTRSLVDHLLSVPLVVRYPPRIGAGLRISTPVTTAALLPTLLDLVGLEAPPGIQTQSFAPLFDGTAAPGSPLLAEGYAEDGRLEAPDFVPRSPFDRLGVRYRALEEDGYKLIVDSTGRQWLFEPLADPSESVDLAAEHPEVVERLSRRLETLVEGYGLGALDRRLAESDAEIDPKVREKLRALGYVQ